MEDPEKSLEELSMDIEEPAVLLEEPGRNMSRYWEYRFEGARKNYNERNYDESSYICKKLLEEPGCPRLWRAWSHLIISMCPSKNHESIEWHSNQAEEQFRKMLEDIPESEDLKEAHLQAKKMCEAIRLDAVESKKAT